MGTIIIKSTASKKATQLFRQHKIVQYIRRFIELQLLGIKYKIVEEIDFVGIFSCVQVTFY